MLVRELLKRLCLYEENAEVMLAIVAPIFGHHMFDRLNQAFQTTLVRSDLVVQPLRLRDHHPTESIIHGPEPMRHLIHGARIEGNTDGGSTLCVHFSTASVANHPY